MRLSIPVLALALLIFALPASSQDYRIGDRLKPSATTARTTYQEVTWDDLIPKDWDAMAALKGINVARLRDGDPKAQEALEKLRAAWDAAPVVSTLENKRIRLAGFIVPLERKGDLVSELLLGPSFGACIHSPPPPANQTVHVILNKPVAGLQTMDTFWINGTLKTARGESGFGVFGYRLQGESMERYEIKRTR